MPHIWRKRKRKKTEDEHPDETSASSMGDVKPPLAASDALAGLSGGVENQGVVVKMEHDNTGTVICSLLLTPCEGRT